MNKEKAPTLIANISDDTKARLQKLAAKPINNGKTQNVEASDVQQATKQYSTETTKQNNTECNEDNKTITTHLKEQQTEAQEPSKSQSRKFISHKDYCAMLKHMQEHYSKCFTIPPSPLAIGIHNQIFAIKDMPFSKTKLRRFLARYTRTRKYFDNLIVGNDRLALDGTSASKVLAEEVKTIKNKNNINKNDNKSNNKKHKTEDKMTSPLE